MLPALLAAAMAVVVPLAFSPTLSTFRVDALPFGQAGQSAVTGQGGPLGPGGGDGAGRLGGSGTDGIGSAELGAGPGLSGLRTIDLVDNLQAVLSSRSAEVMFDAGTAVPTYWQIAVLTRFNGQILLAAPTTESAAEAFAQPVERTVPGLPALPEPRVTKTFRATVTIADLESTLLPLPPTTVSVGDTADVVPGFGAVQAIESPPGQTYTAVARVPVKPGTTTRGGAGGSTSPPGATGPVPASSLAPYLQVPVMSSQVVQLAHQIVAGADGPAARAADLTRFFNGGRFRYTLNPPSSTGADPLVSFLFVTRAGFCQQFAGAYAALARIDGLPTRIAVGFTTGTTEGRDRYQVTGADAHVWPEVYLGPSTGWTSYEPTPAAAGETAGIGINSGSRTGAQHAGSEHTASTASTVTPSHHPVSPHFPVPPTLPRVVHGKTSAGVKGRSWVPPTVITLIVVAVGAVAAVVAVVVVRLRRRTPRGLVHGRRRPGGGPVRPLLDLLDRLGLRRRHRPVTDPTAEVLTQWQETASLLERARLGRRPAETLPEHARRLQSLADARWLGGYAPLVSGVSARDASARAGLGAAGLGSGAGLGAGAGVGAGGSAGTTTSTDEIGAAVEAYERLAALAARAAYSPDACTFEEATDAEHLGAVVRAGLVRPTRRRDQPVPV